MRKPKATLTKTVLVSIRMRPPEAESLYRIARRFGLSKSEVVRWLVTREDGRLDGQQDEVKHDSSE